MKSTRAIVPLTFLAFLSVAAPTALQAVDAGWGLQVGVAKPSGDLDTFTSDAKIGGFGLHALVDFGGGQALRPRVETWFSGKRVTLDAEVPVTSYRNKAQQTLFGADYLYFPGSNVEKGGYLLAGAGVSANKMTGSLISYPMGVKTRTLVSQTSSKPYGALGGGYQFNRCWGMEARFCASRWQDKEVPAPDGSKNIKTWSILGTFRF